MVFSLRMLIPVLRTFYKVHALNYHCSTRDMLVNMTSKHLPGNIQGDKNKSKVYSATERNKVGESAFGGEKRSFY